MKPEAIFLPMIVLALWTGFVGFLTAFRRIRAVRIGRIPASAFRLGETKEVPPDVSVGNRNLMNLLEMPLLFYVVCTSIYVTQNTAMGLVRFAWAFVALRILHSIVHLTSNHIPHRLIAFLLSNLVLLAMWIWFAASVV